MNKSTICRVSHILLAMVAFVMSSLAQSTCHIRGNFPKPSTESQATALNLKSADSPHGYRVVRQVSDRTLHRTWQWLQSCDSPEAPARLTWVEMKPDESSEARATAVDVKAGDGIMFLSSTSDVSIALRAVALESGNTGQVVHVRVRSFHGDRVLAARVISTGNVVPVSPEREQP